MRAIVAVSQNWGIGRDGQLLFRISTDLQRFKALTTGHTILMGRRTFESLPKGALPNRRNLVLSSNPALEFPGAERYSSLNEALTHCAPEEQVYIIGGASLYQQAIPLADELCLTEIEAEATQVDTYFPEIDPNVWVEKERVPQPKDEKHPYEYAFVTYQRR